MLGLASATSNYPCIKCKMHKDNFFDSSLTAERRSTEEIINLVKKGSGQKYC